MKIEKLFPLFAISSLLAILLLTSCGGGGHPEKEMKSSTESKQYDSDSNVSKDMIDSSNETYTPDTTAKKSGQASSEKKADIKIIKQVGGVALRNDADSEVYFYLLDGLQDNYENVLPPNRNREFRIASSPCALKIVGQQGKWELEKGKRYQFMLDDDKWNLVEAQ